MALNRKPPRHPVGSNAPAPAAAAPAAAAPAAAAPAAANLAQVAGQTAVRSLVVGGMSVTALAGAGGYLYFIDPLTGSPMRQTAEGVIEAIGGVAAEAGAGIQANAMEEGLASTLEVLGRQLSYLSSAFGLNADLGIGLQNYALAMQGEPQIENDIFGRATDPMPFDNKDNTDVPAPRDHTPVADNENGTAPVDSNEDEVAPGADATVAASTVPTEPDGTQEEYASVETPDATPASPVESAMQLSLNINRQATLNELNGSGGDIQSPCGNLRDLYAAAANYNGANSNLLAEFTNNRSINLALQRCDIGAPS